MRGLLLASVVMMTGSTVPPKSPPVPERPAAPCPEKRPVTPERPSDAQRFVPGLF